jgi:hypothetical protein
MTPRGKKLLCLGMAMLPFPNCLYASPPIARSVRKITGSLYRQAVDGYCAGIGADGLGQYDKIFAMKFSPTSAATGARLRW